MILQQMKIDKKGFFCIYNFLTALINYIYERETVSIIYYIGRHELCS